MNQASRDLDAGGSSRAVMRAPRAASPRPSTRRRPDDAPVQIGNWDLVRVLGSGADADVYLAQHRDNGRRCAVKLVRHDSTSTYDRRRHLDEIRAIIAIDHRNVVRLYEAGELDDRRIYLVMEYLEGTTLRAVIDERGPLGANVLLQVGLLVARGLGAAHARGIVHRDLKPSNVMVIPTGNGRFTVKLIDFGIAKFMGGETNTIVGTPAYMSPEAARGDALDHRTDIYSFGVMLHRASTGGYPDRDRSAAWDLRASRTPIRNPSECTLQTIIDRCLRRDPSHRFPTTAHLIAELETARARLKRSTPRPARGTPTDDATTSWWLRDDTVFSTHQTVPPRPGSEGPEVEAATSLRIGALPLPAPRPSAPVISPSEQTIKDPAVAAAPASSAGPAAAPRARATGTGSPPLRDNQTSGLLVVPPAAGGVPRSQIAPAASLPVLVTGRRPPLRRRLASAVAAQISRRARLLIGVTVALGIVLGAVIPIVTRDDDPPAPPAQAEIARPAPPPAVAPAPAPVLERAACAPAAPERIGLPSRAAFAWYGSGPDEARPQAPRAKAKRRAPDRARRPAAPKDPTDSDDDVEIRVDED